MRLVKKTVNQDDVSAYHFFYGDEIGRPGTEVTFFDWPAASPNRPGIGAISNISLSVDGNEAVDWWKEHLLQSNVEVLQTRSLDDVSIVDFLDPEGQALSIVGQAGIGLPWKKSVVPAQYGLHGMHHVTLTVRRLATISRVLVDVLGMEVASEYTLGDSTYTVFEMGEGGAGRQVHVVERPSDPPVYVGAGGVHHVAFRTPNASEQLEWLDIIQSSGLHASSIVDRYYFKSIYFREPGGILFEIATDGPGFAADEDVEHLGEKLSLPPFLEPRRDSIEAGLQPV
jgi:glyoxalase family protein